MTMTTHVPINNIQHQNLTVKPCYSAEYGHEVGAIRVFPTEFADIQREYPIVLHKSESSETYVALAVLGFSPNENLFLQPLNTSDASNGWSGTYIPSLFAKGPFLIGYEDRSQSGGDPRASVIHIDMDDPRVNTENGIPIFKEHGGNSDYLESVSRVLGGIERGIPFSEAMFTALEALDLIEPMSLEVEFMNGERARLEGNHTINQNRLAELSGAELEQLNKAGYLHATFLLLSSLDNIPRLINLKNARVAETV